MPNRNAPYGLRQNGWYMDKVNNVLEWYSNGVKVGQASGATVTMAGAQTVTTGGLTVTAGNVVATAGDVRITAANLRLGAVETFGTTEPTSAVVMKTGTAPAGAITTSGGLFSSATVVQKIIAAGTVSNVET